MDLGTFYREFQNPPQLTSLSLHISSQSMAEDLVTQTAAISHICKNGTALPAATSHRYLFFLFGARQDSLPEKLAVYEKNIDEFDAFVDMLQ